MNTTQSWTYMSRNSITKILKRTISLESIDCPLNGLE